ncbi:MAG: T9SS type A sorting domain-containing protein, partial [Cyclobacteriaceae bacterium]
MTILKHNLCLRQLLLLILLILTTQHAVAQDYYDFTYLRVRNPDNGFNKLKLFNNAYLAWHEYDVVYYGNTHMELTFRITEGDPDLSKIQIRPNGSSANPVSIAPYLPSDFKKGYDWTTISIPLSDFDPSVDFTKLKVVQVPYSAGAGKFVFDLEKLVFTGGTSIFDWYGIYDHGNLHDGYGNLYQMIAHEQSDLYLSADLEYSKATAPYNGSVKLMATYQDQYDQDAFDHLWTWTDGYTGRERSGLAPGRYSVTFGPVDSRYAHLNFEILSAGPINAQVDLTTPTETVPGAYTVTASGGIPHYTNGSGEALRYNAFDTTYLQGEIMFGGKGYRIANSTFAQDYEKRYYMVQPVWHSTPELVSRRYKDYRVLWARPLDYVLRDHIYHTDDLGNTLSFQRVKKESVIDGRKYQSPHEVHAMVMYDEWGKIRWVKYFDDLIFSVRTIGVVVDHQGKITWAVRQKDHRGSHTIVITVGMNGNEISRTYSANHNDPTYMMQDFLVVQPDDRVYLLSKQTAGTELAGHTTAQDGYHLYRFAKDGSLETAIYTSGEFSRKSNGWCYSCPIPNSSKLVFRVDENIYRHYDENGNILWEIGSGYFGENAIYLSTGYPDYYYNILSYNLDTLGKLDVHDGINWVREDRLGNIHIRTFSYDNYPASSHFRVRPTAGASGTIPAGSTSFAFELTDQVDNKYIYSASFVSSRVAADEEDIGIPRGSAGLLIYPNPSTSDVQFRHSEGLPDNTLTLTDLSGRVVGQ